MEDRDWIILKTLYEQKNITKTAQSLYISQPALTARLKHIEEEFGVKIACRTTKGLHFTTQGEFLAKAATKALADLREIKEEVTNLDDKVAGTLRIGATGYFTKYTLPRLLRLFREQYPDVEFKVITTWSREVFNLMYNQDIHVGFVSSDYGWENKKYMLFEEPICIASLNEINMIDLPQLPRISYQSDTLIKSVIDKWWRENFSVPPHISMEVDKLDTCFEMVINGLGYAIMPGMRLDHQNRLYKIILKNKTGQPLLRSSWMIYYQELLEMNAVQAFVNFIENIDFRSMLFGK